MMVSLSETDLEKQWCLILFGKTAPFAELLKVSVWAENLFPCTQMKFECVTCQDLLITKTVELWVKAMLK